MNLRANPSEAQGGICHCVPYNEGDNSGERGKKASRDRARRAHHGHSAQQRLGVGAPFAPSPFRLPLGRPTRGTTDTRRASRKLRLLPSASTHTSCHGSHTSRRQPEVDPQRAETEQQAPLSPSTPKLRRTALPPPLPPHDMTLTTLSLPRWKQCYDLGNCYVPGNIKSWK